MACNLACKPSHKNSVTSACRKNAEISESIYKA